MAHGGLGVVRLDAGDGVQQAHGVAAMNFVCDEPAQQRCKTCGGYYDREAFFRHKNDKRRLHISSREFHTVCIGCETTERTERKKADSWLEKARSTIQRHAKRYGRTTQQFIRIYGWDAPRIAHILEHAFDNTCVYCREAYKTMPNPQWQVTMDIIDPQKQPFLATNVQPCCQTCNREKSNTDPELWARKLQAWAEWEDHRKRSAPRAVQLILDLAA
jgi:hypothetical protein